MCSVLLLCWTLNEPMDCSCLGSSIHGIILPVILEWVAITSSRGFLTQGSNLYLFGRQILYHLSHLGKSREMDTLFVYFFIIN